MRFSLRQVEVFLAIANSENMTKASEQLSMSQSAASSALKELESQYDAQLFDRIGKRLSLNEHGERVRQEAIALMAQSQVFERAMRSAESLGNLHVGATLTIGNYLAVDMVAKFMRAHAESHVDLTVSNTEHVLGRLLNYEIDIALVEGELNHKDVEVRHWFDDQLCIVCAPEHELASISLERVLTDKDLIAAPWISREVGSGTRQGFERAMRGIMSDLSILLELEHTEAIKRAVRSNLGLACVSEIAVEDEVNEGKLFKLPVVGRELRRGLYWITHKKRANTPVLTRFIEECVLTEQ
ncbi:MAG: LysR family transcriptional regulator [Sinobacterium sp.]|nr:LysR family transcriptional regulator [Sinobacterium sp.]